jgi:TnpA family transposase
VVPIPSIYARPNRKYFGPDRGVTWLNMINDQAAGLAGKVVSGTARDSLHMIDVAFSQDQGQRPDIIVADTGSFSDLVFGLCHLLGREYRPALADMPDQRSWRADRNADYGQLNTGARGMINLEWIRRHWPDMLRVVASNYTGAVRAYDVTRVLQRDGNPTPLGEAFQMYGRIFKSLHILACLDDENYRRDIKGIRNLQEGRHSLAGKIFHGKKGDLYQRYRDGMEDQLGALGLVLNCVVLWNTVYMNAALDQLRATGRPVLDADVVRCPHSCAATSACTATTRSWCPSSPATCESCATRTATPRRRTERPRAPRLSLYPAKGRVRPQTSATRPERPSRWRGPRWPACPSEQERRSRPGIVLLGHTPPGGSSTGTRSTPNSPSMHSPVEPPTTSSPA